MNENSQNNVFDQWIKNRLAYLNFNVIFESLDKLL